MRPYERLIKYVKYPTASNPESPTCPSTPDQNVLALALVDEMKDIGLENVEIDDNGYIYGSIPASEGYTDSPSIGFIAHMDVSPDAPSINVKPNVIAYEGGEILLNKELDIKMDPNEYPELNQFRGKHLMVTDGTTLLGSDDKSGIAEILTAAEQIINDSDFKHGPLKIGFTPDEEIGRGADKFDIQKFGADFAYTVDGDSVNSIDYETFNAAHAIVKITGVAIHPGSAKNKMINASTVAMEFHSLLPALEVPEKTEGKEGFSHLFKIQGNCGECTIEYIIRDHDDEKLKCKVNNFYKAAEEINSRYGMEICTVESGFDYRNMKCVIEENFHLVENARKAIEKAGLTPQSVATRGGTDGCELSFKGLPCPNLGTGGGNFHSVYEYVCIEDMEKMVEIIKNIIKLYSK